MYIIYYNPIIVSYLYHELAQVANQASGLLLTIGNINERGRG
jgi:hypothetical protein